MSRRTDPSDLSDSLTIKQFLKEPLLHFLIIGALLFGSYTWINRGVGSSAHGQRREVRITANEVAFLKQTWERQWQRPPDERELKSLVDDYLREELLAREASEIGLGNDDTVVRRRLAQKMEFLVRESACITEPEETELRRFFESNRERFQTPARVSFSHIFFNRDKRGKSAQRDAVAVLQKLSGTELPMEVSELGDGILLPDHFTAQDMQAVTVQFGAEFADSVFAAETGKWLGPVESAYGVHLVCITDKTEAQPWTFAEAREAVLALSRDQRQRAESDEFYASLRKKYDVVVDETVRPLLEMGRLAREEVHP